MKQEDQQVIVAHGSALPGSLYLHNGRWYWAVRLPGEPKRRARPLVSRGHKYATTDRKTAEKLAVQLWRRAEDSAGIARQTNHSGFDGTLRTIRIRWLAEYGSFRWGVGSSQYEKADLATRWCLDCQVQGESVTPSTVERVLSGWAQSGLALRTINQRLPMIQRMFKWAAKERLIPPDVFGTVELVEKLVDGRTPAASPKTITSVRDSVADATLPYLPPVIRDMIRVHRLTGMRSGELCDLSWARIDRTGDIWVYVPEKHKTKSKGKIRVVAIGPKAQAILLAYAGRPATSPIFSASEAQSQRVSAWRASGAKRMGSVPERMRDRFDARSYAKAIVYAIRQSRYDGCRLPHWHPHQLRHAAATGAYLTLGASHAQAALGHSDAETTMIYVDRDAQLKEQIRQAVETARATG